MGRAYDVSYRIRGRIVRTPRVVFRSIYLTDANWVFGITVPSHYLLSFGDGSRRAHRWNRPSSVESAPPSERNVAGAERAFDLTPTQNLNERRRYEREYKRQVRTGSASVLRVIKEEFMYEIERRYRVSADRTFIGYSLGGLFGVYALFQSPE